MIEEVLVDRLLAWPGLAALIGTRLDPVVTLGETTVPGVVYRRISEEWTFSMAGATTGGTWTGEFECWHPEYQGALAIEKQLRLALNGWQSLSENVYVVSTQGGGDIYDDLVNVFGRVIEARIEYHE